MSSGRYLLITHDDDIMEPEMALSQMQYFRRNPSTVAVATNVSLNDEAGSILQAKLYRLEEDRVFFKNDYLRAYLSEKIWLPTPTIMFHRATLLSTFSQWIRLSERETQYRPSLDIFLIVVMNTAGPVALLKQPLLRYRQHGSQESRNVDQTFPMLDLLRLIIKDGDLLFFHHGLRKNLLGLYLKYCAQHILLNCQAEDKIPSRLKSLSRIYLKNELHEGVTECLPYELLCLQFDVPLVGAKFQSKAEKMSPIETAYFNWIGRRRSNLDLFKGFNPENSVIIFGSMLTAFMIVKDAIDKGLKIAAIVDTSPARIGQAVLGVPVVGLSELQKVLDPVDLIVLSNEREQHTAVRNQIHQQISGANIAITSWIEMVTE